MSLEVLQAAQLRIRCDQCEFTMDCMFCACCEHSLACTKHDNPQEFI